MKDEKESVDRRVSNRMRTMVNHDITDKLREGRNLLMVDRPHAERLYSVH